MMTKQQFSKILEEYGFGEQQIVILWNSRPSDDLEEARIRRVAEQIAPIKDCLIQA